MNQYSYFGISSSDGKSKMSNEMLITSSYVFDAMNFLGENVNLDVELAYIF